MPKILEGGRPKPVGGYSSATQGISSLAARNPQPSLAGHALRNLGLQIQRLGIDNERRKAAEKEKLDRASFANLRAQADPNPVIFAARDEAKSDGSDLYERTREGLFEWMAAESEKAPNAEVGLRLREYLAGRVSSGLSSAGEYARKMQEDDSRVKMDSSLDALYNQVKLTPDDYDILLTEGVDLIGTSPLTDRPETKHAFQRELAQRRFEGMIDESKDPNDLEMISGEIAQWKDRLSVSDFNDLRRDVEVKKRDQKRKFYTLAKAKVNTLSDATNDLIEIPEKELTETQNMALAADDLEIEAKLLRVSRNQQLLRRYGHTPPDDLQREASEMKRSAMSNMRLNPEVSAAIEAASDFVGGSVPISYLLASARMEAGKEIVKDKPDFGIRSPSSSATGIYQFIDSTWLSMALKYGDELAPGMSSMSEKERLALRADPAISARAAAMLAKDNKQYLESKLKRPVDDFGLYLAHFWGPGAAVELIRGMGNERIADKPADSYFPHEAKYNKQIFYSGDRPRSVKEVYDTLIERFEGQWQQVELGDAAYVEHMAERNKEAIKKNMVGHAREQGIEVGDLEEEGGFADRQEAMDVLTQTWGVPQDEVKPLRARIPHPQRLIAYRRVEIKTDPTALAGPLPLL